MSIFITHTQYSWVVKWRSRPSEKYGMRYFSYRKHGGVDKAYRLAEEYMQKLIEEHPEYKKKPYKYKARDNSTSSKTGVFRTYTTDTSDKPPKRYDYWGANYHYYKDGKKKVGQRRFLVNTHGEEKARVKAIAFREAWEEAVDRGWDAVNEFLARDKSKSHR